MAHLILLMVIAMAAPPAAFLSYFLPKMPWWQAVQGVAGTWSGFLGSDIAHNAFYQRGMGLDHPWRNVGLMIGEFSGIVIWAGLFILAILYSSNTRRAILLLGLAAILSVGIIRVEIFWAPFFLFNRSLPLSLLAAAIMILTFHLQRPRDRDEIARLAPLALWVVLAIGLLAKIALNARIWQYGFVLAMPAAILLVAILVGMIPEILQRRHGRGNWFRLAAVLVILLDLGFAWQYSYRRYSKKDLLVGERGDAIITYGNQTSPKGAAVRQLLQFIQSALPPEASFSVLPEGVMINYLTRHPNPTPYSNFMPPEMEIFGEGAILNSFKRTPPDYLILIHKDTREYGVGNFGTDPNYGKKITDWIKANYVPVRQILAEPLRDEKFGIKVLQWNSSR